jgi:uroporphyrinogen-III decarboxylase
MATAMYQDYLHEIFEKQVEIALSNLEKIHGVLGDAIGLAYVCGNDFGTQNGPFCSVETFRELYAPYYKKINGWIHRNTSWKTFKHSCGSIYPLIPEMIDAGFDIINPVQWTANEMQPQRLKAEFGKNIVFWGGGVDTQKTLPFGTPDQVRKEVLAMCEVFSKDGGFVFNTVHNILANTPTENLVAMIEAIREFNGG